MARSKKKTISQKVVGAATVGMPQPARKLLGNRIIAGLILVTVPVLFATGMVSLKWEGGRPRLSINRERATELKEEIVQKVEDKQKHDHALSLDHTPLFGGRKDQHEGSPDQWQGNEGFGEKITETFEHARTSIVEDGQQLWNREKELIHSESIENQGFRPFSQTQNPPPTIHR